MRLTRVMVMFGLLATSVVAIPQIASAAVIVKAIADPPLGHFKKAVTRVDAGTKVTFKAVSGSHTVTGYGGWHYSKRIDDSTGGTRPQQVSFRFREPGTYQFRCTIHSQIAGGFCTYMCGTVVVRNR